MLCLPFSGWSKKGNCFLATDGEAQGNSDRSKPNTSCFPEWYSLTLVDRHTTYEFSLKLFLRMSQRKSRWYCESCSCDLHKSSFLCALRRYLYVVVRFKGAEIHNKWEIDSPQCWIGAQILQSKPFIPNIQSNVSSFSQISPLVDQITPDSAVL